MMDNTFFPQDLTSLATHDVNLIVFECVDEIVEQTLNAYGLDFQSHVSLGEVYVLVLTLWKKRINAVNATLPREWKHRLPTVLPHQALLHLCIRTGLFVRIAAGGNNSTADSDLLGLYKPSEGIYTVSAIEIKNVLATLHGDMTEMRIKEVYMGLSRMAPRRYKTLDPDLVPVGNGIFNVAEQKLYPFSPEYVFTWKTSVDYDADAQPVTIVHEKDGTVWDFDSWMESLSDDENVRETLWDMLHASVRPHARWDKVVVLYSDRGNNGKGTLCRLIRNLLTPEAHCSIPITAFDKDFNLTPLMSASVIITDENDVGVFGERMGIWKTVTTGDVFQLTRKYLDPVSVQFTGLQIHCFNEIPRFKDKSASLHRRLLFVPMTKCFTGQERKYIKNDYLGREDVLRYVLRRILQRSVTELSSSSASEALMDEFKVINDPVREFWMSVKDDLVWDAQPRDWLYALYLSWSKVVNPEGRIGKQSTFWSQLRSIVQEISGDQWEVKQSLRPCSKGRMDKGEPLVRTYNVGGIWHNFSLDVDGNGGYGEQARQQLPEVCVGLQRL